MPNNVNVVHRWISSHR